MGSSMAGAANSYIQVILNLSMEQETQENFIEMLSFPATNSIKYIQHVQIKHQNQ